MNKNEMLVLDVVGSAINEVSKHRRANNEEYGLLMVRADTYAYMAVYKERGLPREEMFNTLPILRDKGLIEYHLDSDGDVELGFTNLGIAQYFWNKELI